MTRPVTDAIVVAAGSSRRMAGVDKLDAPLAGRPLLAMSVAAMAGARGIRRVIVVTAASRVDDLRQAAWLTRLGARVVAGGERRSESVLAGLMESDAEVVLVHDGARPLASSALAEAVSLAAAEHGAAIPVLPVADSLKLTDAGRVAGSLDRRNIVRAQTPQAARRELLLAAFSAAAGESFTDEAGLLEAHGVPVVTVPGEALNIKVTERADLELVSSVLAGRGRATDSRIGVGYDSHPFGPEDGLWLGGVLFEEAPRLFGHSDGDVALHALATAILSACGLGDLGRHFPSTDPQHRDAASAEMLAGVVTRAAEAGWRPAAAQVSLLGARPRLGAERLEAMRQRVAEVLVLDLDLVAVAASSANLAGPEGAGRVVSANALATLVRT
ncbi:bifunctional 2-C-methyl-D-erythritol 4-phosphate cytidylyltransferase/2-C-methyl-D-erythritol 2,4-cyclodiphosphate synthase [soil metagenome]